MIHSQNKDKQTIDYNYRNNDNVLKKLMSKNRAGNSYLLNYLSNIPFSWFYYFTLLFTTHNAGFYHISRAMLSEFVGLQNEGTCKLADQSISSLTSHRVTST